MLVVDDVHTSRLLVSRILEKRGHVVKFAENGIEAIEELACEDFDLVIMDIQMPKMSGLEAASAIRSGIYNVRSREIPILATSASADRTIISKCVKAGMNGFIAKPINAQELVSTIQNFEQNSLKQKASQ